MDQPLGDPPPGSLQPRALPYLPGGCSDALAQPLPHPPRTSSPLPPPHSFVAPPPLPHSDSAPALPLHLQRPPLPSAYSTPPPRSSSPYSANLADAQPRMNLVERLQASQAQDTRTQLFVSNLPFRVRWQDLKDLMRKCGTVLRADVALSSTDGRSRGFGVVLFASHASALQAIATYHGYTWQTRILDVRVDAQDPTGALALAEANRAMAVERGRREAERRVGMGSAPAAAMGMNGHAGVGGMQTMLVPVTVPSPAGQYLAPPPPLAASAPPASPAQAPAQPPFTEARRSTTQDALRPSSASGVPLSRPHSSSGASRSASPFLPPPSSSPVLSRRETDRRAPSPFPSAIAPSLAPPLPLPPSNRDVPPQLALAAQQAQQDGPPQVQYIPVPVFPPPSGFLGGMGVHPMGYAVPPVPFVGAAMGSSGGMTGAGPMHGGLAGYYAAQNRASPGPQQQQQYTNRHLFVGNLPFSTQWQELKDLMRGAGSVLRADIAQGPDGRSRGFGSVLFATPQDAERAVQMFNGHDFGGRGLKVHFDKFSGAGINGLSNGTAPNSNYGSPSSSPYLSHPAPPPPPYLQQQQQQLHQFMQAPMPMPAYPQRTVSAFEQQQQYEAGPSALSQPQYAHLQREAGNLRDRGDVQPSPLANPLFNHTPLSPPALEKAYSSISNVSSSSGSIIPEAAPRPSTASSNRPGTAGAPGDGAPPSSASSSSPSTTAADVASLAHIPPSMSHKPHPAAPSRIAMPPPLPFSLATSGPLTGMGGGPFSPLHARNLPPMTPSMPAFTFAPFAAPTPPLHPSAMFSPGIGMGPNGPFSPMGGPGSPYFGPGGWPQTPGWAQTPGVAGGGTGGFNPMFPPFSQIAPQQQPLYEYEQQQQGRPQTHMPGGIPEQRSADEYSRHEADAAAATQQDEPSYFPPLPSGSSSLPAAAKAALTSHAASAPPLSPEPSPSAAPRYSSSMLNRPSLAGHSKSDPAAVARLTSATDALSLAAPQQGSDFDLEGGQVGSGRRGGSPPDPAIHSLSHAAASGDLEGSVNQQRRRSFLAPGGGAEATEEGAQLGGGGRRASFDAGLAHGGVSGRRVAFGTSIWG